MKFKSFFAFVVLYFMAWFNRLGLLNLGQFWPLFVVEWRIFISHETRRIHALAFVGRLIKKGGSCVDSWLIYT